MAESESDTENTSPIRGMSFQEWAAFNQTQVIRYLRRNGPTGRHRLADELGLARSTISGIIDDLVEQGIATEGKKIINARRRGARISPIALIHPEEPTTDALGSD